eukprot:TRINITY_DN124932_c0_g1_i1.p1 TRINITY_DN124932_c0_g1~~TRINITY_DN124932_c0_g1_i1.p1  ORF type:complete len:509 (+),score=63.55 TRINITY_DN124932_c0_g1_i1:101-1627(+)
MTFNDGKCLCVRGLPGSCQVADLDALFCAHGRVANVHLPVDPLSKGHRGYAFVTMSSPRAAQASIAALNGAELERGGRLMVEVSRRSAPHSKTPGHYLGLAAVKTGGCLALKDAARNSGRGIGALALGRSLSPGPMSMKDHRRGGGRLDRNGVDRCRRGGGQNGSCRAQDSSNDPPLQSRQSNRTPSPNGDMADAEPLCEPQSGSASSSHLTELGGRRGGNLSPQGRGHSGRRSSHGHVHHHSRQRFKHHCWAETADSEPLSEPAAAAPASSLSIREPFVEPVAEPGGEPLIEEDPGRSPDEGPEPMSPGRTTGVSDRRGCESMVRNPTPQPAQSPRSRISQLEEANIQSTAKQTVDGLLLHFERHGFEDPRVAAGDCLQVAADMLGIDAFDCGPRRHHNHDYDKKPTEHHHGHPSVILSPEEFKNPSSFLRVYGDPLACGARKGGHQPESHLDGNWRCDHCGNVNFPRRQRCNKCQHIRGPAGDAVVLRYSLRVYETLVKGGDKLSE